MNRHKSNWSAMGAGERTETNTLTNKIEADKRKLKEMCHFYGKDDVVRWLREIYLEEVEK